MDFLFIFLILLLSILSIALIILLVCVLQGQTCTISFQKRTPNLELTRAQLEEGRRKKNSVGSKFKRALQTSSDAHRSPAPVENINTVALTLKFGDDETNGEHMTTTNETSFKLLPSNFNNKAERNASEKRLKGLKKMYNL